MIEIPEPVEDVDFFVVKRVRYELHVEGTFFITADEECDDFEVDAVKCDLSAPTIVGTTVVGREERRMDDPTQPFDRNAWIIAKRIELGDMVRPHEKPRPVNETTLEAFDMKKAYFVSGDITDGIGFAVVAESETEAIAIAWEEVLRDEGWEGMDHIECHPAISANIDGLPIGMVWDERDALCRGMYDYLREYECDECKQDADVTCYKGRALCEDCIFNAIAEEDNADLV